jgi:hypothetical protein
MSIEWVHEKSRSGKVDKNGRHYVRNYQVKVSAITDTIPTIADYFQSTSELPYVYDFYPSDTNAICTDLDIRRDDEGRLFWNVAVHYRPRNQNLISGDESIAFPWQARPLIDFDWARLNKVVDRAYRMTKDDSGASQDERESPSVPIENSAGQSFDPPIMQDVSNLVIKIRRNEKDFSPGRAEKYKNTINSEQLVVADVKIEPKCGLMRGIRGKPAWNEDGQKYWEVEYTIEVRPDTHIRKILDVGYYTKDEDGEWTPIKDTDDNYVTEPKKMDGEGGVLADGADPVYLEYQTYYAINWTNLDLPKEV